MTVVIPGHLHHNPRQQSLQAPACEVCLEDIYLNNKRAWENQALKRAEDRRERQQGNFNRNSMTMPQKEQKEINL